MAALALELVGLSFDQASVQSFLVCSGVDGLLVGEAARLDQLALLFISCDHSKEVLLDLFELSLKLFSLVVLCLLGLWGLLVSETFRNIKSLFTPKFAIEDGQHNLTLLWLECLVV